MRMLHRAATALTAGALLVVTAVAAGGGARAAGNPNAPGQIKHTEQAVCADLLPAGYARCNAHVRTDSDAVGRAPAAPGAAAAAGVGANATVGNNGAYDPMYLQSAYNDPAYSWTNAVYGSSTAGSHQIVAIVDAYDDPSAASDLAYYRSYFHLPACPAATSITAPISAGPGCTFYKVNQSGQLGSYPSGNSGWAQEESLDVDMVSAMCPNCTIVLVEASDNSMANLGQSVNEAVNLGANVVSNSYGSSEYSTEDSDSQAYYKHSNVSIVASSGDNGYGVEFPAASNSVTAVGGTSLNEPSNAGSRGTATETAWSGAGSGCSSWESKPAWQVDPVSTCANRTVADVSAVADPNTGVWVYDRGWYVFGGTSVASPIIGSVFAVGGSLNGSAPNSPIPSWPYGNTNYLNDVTSGSNGSCGGSYLCQAGTGYDGPTGLGTPNTATAFTGAVAPPPSSPPAPGAPTSVIATAGNAKVTLQWQPPTSGGAVSSYSVLRGTSSEGENTTVASGVTLLSYTDTTVSNGTTYFYKIEAVNSGGHTLSTEASATPQGLPGAPTNLHLTKASPGVALTWTVPSGAPQSYKLYRSTRSGRESYIGPASAVCTGTSQGQTCSATDTSATSGVTYYYKVAAVNAAGTGQLSNQAGPIQAG